MKRFSKIITVILTVLLLCGLVVPFAAFADETNAQSREVLNVTKSSKNLYTDFESTDNNGNHYIRFFPGEYSSSTSNSFQVDYPTVSGNTYARYSSKGNNTLAGAEVTAVANIMPDYKINNSSRTVYNMGAYDYAVLDFEIASDKYTFTFKADVKTSYTQGNGAPTVTNATGVTVYKTVDTRAEFESYLNGTKQIPQEVVEWTAGSVNHKKVYTYTNVTVNDDLKLAYDGDADTYIFPEYRTYRFASNAEGDKGNTGNFRLRIRYDSSAKKWYADTAGGNRVYLSDKLGVFNHVTYVFETVRTASTSASSGYHINNSKVHVFVNGTHVSSNNLFNNQNANETYTIIRLRTEISKYAQNRDGLSICFDNVALNLYGYRGMDYSTKQYEQTGRVYESAGYGIDEYIDNGDYKKNADTGAAAKPLWSCEQIVYDVDYLSPNAYVSIDDEKRSVAVDEFLSNIKNGSTIEVCRTDVLNFEVPEGVNNFTFKLLTDASFTLGSNSAEKFLVVPGSEDGVYTVRPATEDDFLTLNWTYVFGGNATLLKSQRIAFDVMPAFSTDGIENSDVANFLEGLELEWMFDVDGDASNFGPLYNEEINLYAPEQIRPLTRLEVLLVREELGAELTVYAEGETELPTTLPKSTLNSLPGSNNPREQYKVSANSQESLPLAVAGACETQNQDVGMPCEISGAAASDGTPVNAETILNVNFISEPEITDVIVTDTVHESAAWLWYVVAILTVAIPVAVLMKCRNDA